MRHTQAQSVAWAISSYRDWTNKGIGLEVKDGHIFYNRNKVGYVADESDMTDMLFVALTLQTCFLPDRVVKKLIEAVHEFDIKVVFVPVIDIGFGLPEPQYLTLKEQYRILKRIASYSTENTKTAIMAGTGDHVTYPTKRAAIAYTFNQDISGQVYHAEQTLSEFLNLHDITLQHDTDHWLSILEPCEHCLAEMIDHGGARTISYIVPHKDKWNTVDYIQLVMDIAAKRYKTPEGYPVIFKKESVE